MLDLEIFTGEIGASGRRLIRKSYDEAKSRGYNQIVPENILFSFAKIEPSFFCEVMQSLNLDPQVVLQALETELAQCQYIGRRTEMSESFRTLLASALKQAYESNRRFIESTDIFVAIFQNKQGVAVKLFEQLGADREMIVQKIQRQIRSRKSTDSQPKDNHRGHQQ